MATVHTFQSDTVILQADDLLGVESSVNWWFWVDTLNPDAESLAEAGFWAEVEDANASLPDDLIAVIQYQLEIPDHVVAAGAEAIQDFMDDAEMDSFPGATIVRQNDAAELVQAADKDRARIADESQRAAEAAEAEARRKQTPYWHYSDGRDEGQELLPATHWAWQTGNTWVAVTGETHDSWFDEDFRKGFTAQNLDRLLRPIEKIPTTGTLSYWDHEGWHQLEGAEDHHNKLSLEAA
jgi:hypothetical protein